MLLSAAAAASALSRCACPVDWLVWLVLLCSVFRHPVVVLVGAYCDPVAVLVGAD